MILTLSIYSIYNNKLNEYMIIFNSSKIINVINYIIDNYNLNRNDFIEKVLLDELYIDNNNGYKLELVEEINL